MRLTFRTAAVPVLLLAVTACGAPIDTPSATSAVALPAPSTAPDPTPVIAPSVAPASTFVAEGAAPQLECGGGLISRADIDYVADAQGVPDILAATQRLIGVRPTDMIVVEPAVTVVVRDGRAIWRGDWHDGGQGFLLGSKMACQDAGIR
jgi:hypothetical protein